MLDESEHVEEIRKRIEEFLKDKSYSFNPDPDIVNSILKAMTKRYIKHGKDYCPCRVVTGDKEKDEQIVCPCVFHQREVEDDGHCHCMLFTRQQGKTAEAKGKAEAKAKARAEAKAKK